MFQFEVRGPYQVPVTAGSGGRTITGQDGAEFWDEHPELAKECGVYVFAIRTGRAIQPTYVGKASRNFGQEAFQSHKLSSHFNRALVRYRKGTPVMFFLLHPKQKGRTNNKFIESLEKFLIKTCKAANPDGLTNKNHAAEPQWSIRGVIRSDQGKPSHAAADFKKMIRL